MVINQISPTLELIDYILTSYLQLVYNYAVAAAVEVDVVFMRFSRIRALLPLRPRW